MTWKPKKRFFLLIVLCAVLSGSLEAVTPMAYYNTLVAGAGTAGFQDGGFAEARFNYPSGFAMNGDGTKLYVADLGNDRIRVIHLDDNNRVDTLTGSLPGAKDGGLSEAKFSAPQKLALLSDSRLAVYEAGNSDIRLIDLQSGQVSTVAKGLKVWDMVYRVQDDSLYFSEPDEKKLEKLDMRSLQITTLMFNSPPVQSPGALCLYEDGLCLADAEQPGVYWLKFTKEQKTSEMISIGATDRVVELAVADGLVYALRVGGDLVKVAAPESQVVKLMSPWGFLFSNKDHKGIFPFFDLSDDPREGFLASPNEARKFYIGTKGAILSVVDYHFDELKSAFQNGDELTDFDYPALKPPHTFRILMIGGSRNSTAVFVPADPKGIVDEDDTQSDFKVNTFPKQLEFLLNTEAALANKKVRFEVLNMVRRGLGTSSFADRIPNIVQNYGIDLVVNLADRTGYQDYYEKKLGPEGVPLSDSGFLDMSLKLSERAPAGAAKDILERCKALKIPYSEKQNCPGDELWELFCTGDQQMEKDLIELSGRRLSLMDEKDRKTPTHPPFILCYVPCDMFPNDCCVKFWGDLCATFGFKFIDFTEGYNALKVAYYPTDVKHYTAYGNQLIAQLLNHYLLENHLIP